MYVCVCVGGYHQIQSSPEILNEFGAVMDNLVKQSFKKSEGWSYSSVIEYLMSL